ncbi:MAG: PilZ domain-containing protein [Myxococcales bacterium]
MRRRTGMDGGGSGLRVYADEQPKPGARCRLEIFLPDGSSVLCRTQVAWVEPLPEGGPARFDVGLTLTAIHPLDRARLFSVLEHA